MLWVVEVIKWDLRRALCRKRKLLQFKATCTNVTYKPLKYHPDGSFLLHHTFPNCFQKARKEEMKDDRLDGSAKEVVGSYGGRERGSIVFFFHSFFLSFPFPLPPSHTSPPLPPPLRTPTPLNFCQFRYEGKPSTGRRGKCRGGGGALGGCPHRLPQDLGDSSLPSGVSAGGGSATPGEKGRSPAGPGGSASAAPTHVGPAPGSTSACGAGARREKPRGAVEGGTATHRRPRAHSPGPEGRAGRHSSRRRGTGVCGPGREWLRAVRRQLGGEG